MKRILWNIGVLASGFMIGVLFIIYRCGYIVESSKKRADKFQTYFNFMDQWLEYKEQDAHFAKYFHKKNISSVAIYGMGKIGKHLKYELESEGVDLRYVIDESDAALYNNLPHYNLKDRLPLVDAVIVTPINEYEDIKKKILENNSKLKVILISEIID